MKNLRMLLLIPVAGFALAGCGAIQFNATCSNGGHCTGTVGPADASVSSSASIPGLQSPQPAATITQVVQQCLPDPTESQLTSLASGNIPACLDVQDQQVFVTVIINELNQTPRSQLHTQQGRDDWRDHQVAAAVQQADQQG